jgi:hypothetical protein
MAGGKRSWPFVVTYSKRGGKSADFSRQKDGKSEHYIPDDQQLASNIPQQVFEESNYILPSVGPLLHYQVQFAFWCNDAHSRKVVSAQGGADNGGLTHRGVGAHLPPAPDGFLVPLGDPLHRLLAAPATGFQDAAHLGRVVGDSEPVSD